MSGSHRLASSVVTGPPIIQRTLCTARLLLVRMLLTIDPLRPSQADWGADFEKGKRADLSK